MQPAINDNFMFNRLGKSFFKYAFEAAFATSNGKNGNGASDRAFNIAFLLACALFAYAGVETVKIIFRNHFGRNGISIVRLLLSALAFIGVGSVIYYEHTYISQAKINAILEQESFAPHGLFFIGVGCFILVKGLIEYSKARKNNVLHDEYRGNSYLLGFLIGKNCKAAIVQNLIEPLILLVLGGFLSWYYEWFLGVPFLVCAVSYWVHLLMEVIMDVDDVRNALANHGYVHSQNVKVMTVVNDEQ